MGTFVAPSPSVTAAAAWSAPCRAVAARAAARTRWCTHFANQLRDSGHRGSCSCSAVCRRCPLTTRRVAPGHPQAELVQSSVPGRSARNDYFIAGTVSSLAGSERCYHCIADAQANVAKDSCGSIRDIRLRLLPRAAEGLHTCHLACPVQVVTRTRCARSDSSVHQARQPFLKRHKSPQRPPSRKMLSTRLTRSGLRTLRPEHRNAKLSARASSGWIT